MAVTLTDNRTVVNEADATTNWTGTNSISLFTTDPTPIESTGELGATVGAIIFDGYVSISSVDYSDAVVYCWVFSRLALGNTTDANGGLMVLLGDGTNRGAWKVAGADLSAFRHDQGPTGWQCPALDTTNLPASPLDRAGSAASVNFAAITNVGTTVNSLVSAPGMNPTYLMDIIRRLDPTANNGCALSITGGTSGDPGTFAQIAAADRQIGDLQAHGLVRELATGAFGCQGPLRFGDAVGTSSSWFEDTNATFVFENRGFRTTLYKIFITDNGTGTTTFKLGTKVGSGATATGSAGCSLVAPTGVGAEFDAATDTDVTDVFIYGSTFSGFTNGIKLRAGHELIGCTVNASGTVEANGATVVNTSVASSTATRALFWDVATDTNGKLDGMSFVSAGTGHAIELGTNIPTSIDFNNISFSGYAASDGSTGNESVFVNKTTGTLTINVSGGTTPSIRTAGTVVTVVAGTVTASVNVKDLDSGANIENARVFVKAATGGPFPFDVTVTISNSGTTATVTHTGHSMATNDKVVISGASLDANNGIFTITKINNDSYSYTMASDPGGSPTGTIKSTFVVLSGLTDVNGDISMSRVFPSGQPVTGWARKASGSPFYKQSAISGTVSSSTGFSANVLMIVDE